MTVNKITTPPSQKVVIDKINEVIDNLGGGGGGGSYTAGTGIDITSDVISIDDSVVATTNTVQTISGSKTFSAGVITGIGSSLSTDVSAYPLTSYLCVRYNDGSSWVTASSQKRIIKYDHPLENTQGTLEIGSTEKSVVSDNDYYYAGKLRLNAPEILTRYDGINEYEILDTHSVINGGNA